MKIFTTIISHHANNRIESLLKSWILDIRKPHEYLIVGDRKLKEKIKNNCIFFTECEPESYQKLYLKTYKTIEYLLNNCDFDFWHKCDDDVCVSYNRLVQFLSNFNSSQHLYIGCRTHSPKFNHYAAGFNYIISKSLLEKVFTIFTDRMKNDNEIFNYEDKAIGDMAQALNVDLIENKNFICPFSHLDPVTQFKNISGLCLKNKNIIAATIHKQSEKYIPEIYKKMVGFKCIYLA